MLTELKEREQVQYGALAGWKVELHILNSLFFCVMSFYFMPWQSAYVFNSFTLFLWCALKV